MNETAVAIKRWRSRASSSTKGTYKKASLRESKKSAALWSVMRKRTWATKHKCEEAGRWRIRGKRKQFVQQFARKMAERNNRKRAPGSIVENSELLLLFIASSQPGNHRLWPALKAGLSGEDKSTSKPYKMGGSQVQLLWLHGIFMAWLVLI